MIEFVLAGATMVQLGTINYSFPDKSEQILIRLKNWLKKNNINQIMDIKGAIKSHQ